LNTDGTVDWARYREAANLVSFPTSSPVNATEFADGVCVAVETLLRLHDVTKRAPDIFARRTCRDAADRMTLQRVADELHTWLPTIKSEETFFLRWLYDVLVEHDFSSLQVWLDDSWLSYWSEAWQFYKSVDSYDAFADILAWRWRLTGRDVRKAAPLIWAVLDGYPDGRRSGYRPVVAAPAVAALQGRIRLKGFRRLH